MLAACAVAEDYVRLTAGDTGDDSSFIQSSRWSDKKVPHPDADYLVADGLLLRAPQAGNEGSTTNHVFGGRSLTIGTPESAGQLGVRTIKTEKTTVDNLIFVNGQLRQIVNNNDTRLHGAITVQSPSNTPFCIQSSADSTRTIHIDATVSGAEGTGLLFTGDNANSQCTTMLQSANTNYFGTLTIGGGSGNSLILNNSWAAGGDPSTYTPKGLVVKDGATLRFNAEPFSYTNRGLYVESTGGVLYQYNIGTHVFMPLAGTGTLTKTGPAQTTFNGMWTGVTIDVQEGTFAVQSDCPKPGEGAAVVISGGTFGLFGGTAPNLPITLDSGYLSPWSASVGSDGPWTGAVNYLGCPTFFKENRIHRVAVSSVGAHAVSETVCRGVQEGSAQSLQVVNETLFYKSRSDVCIYQGGFPQSISQPLGDEVYTDAAAGAAGDRYYISMRGAGGVYSLFVYDIRHGLWMREDELHAVAFARLGDELYALTGDGTLLALLGTVGEKEPYIAWEAETGLLTYQHPDRKYVSRFNLRLNMEEGAELSVWLMYDSDGTWVRQGRIRMKGTRTVTLPIRPRRCDHLRMKLVGKGEVRLYSIAKILTYGSDVG